MKSTILVVGASGTVGTELVKFLSEAGQDVRLATSRKASRKNQVHLNPLTGEGVEASFQGLDKAFLLSPAGYVDQGAFLQPLLAQAKKHKLKKVVLMTAMGANANPAAPLAQAEATLERLGLPFNIIRPNWFLQNFYSFWGHDITTKGKILLPAGDAKVSFIDARDIARVAAKLLTSSEFDNQAFELTGSVAISHAEAAAALSQATGKKIDYEEASPEELKSKLVGAGLSPEYSDFLNVIFGFLKLGYSAPVTDAVKKITGRDPIRVEAFAQDYKSKWL